MTGVPGPFWPWRGISALEGAALGAVIFVLLAALPFGWWVIRRRAGQHAAGPLWPLILFEILALGYALAVPPWQKPDEPQHMVHVEVTRLAGPSAAEHLLPGSTPSPRLAAIRDRVNTEVADSLADTKSEKWLPAYQRFVEAGDAPGPSELTHPPLYYLIASVLSRPFAGSPILARLAVIRILGIAMAGWVVWCCGAAGRLLFGRRKLAEAPAVLAVALPGFVLLAGAVNNDVLAELLAALLLLLLLAGVLERTAFARPLPWFAGITVLVVLGVFTKRSFLPVAAMVVVAVAVRLRRHPRPMLLAIAALLALTGVVLAAGAKPRLALWKATPITERGRCAGGHAGDWSICLRQPISQLSQRVTLPRLDDVKGREVQLQLWARGSGNAPTIKVDLDTEDTNVATATLRLTDAWTPAVLDGKVPDDPHFLTLAVNHVSGSEVRVDAISLRSIDRAAPGQSFAQPVVGDNVIVNGSGEVGVLGAPEALPSGVRRSLDSAVDSAAGVAYEPGDVVASAPIIARRATQTFGSMWATIGWQGPLRLFPGWLAWLLGALVVAGLVGFGAVVLRMYITLPASTLLIAALVTVAVSTTLQSFPPDEVLTVSGRYLYTGLVAFTVAVAAGWRHLWPVKTSVFRSTVRTFPLVVHALFVALLLVPFLTNGVRI